MRNLSSRNHLRIFAGACWVTLSIYLILHSRSARFSLKSFRQCLYTNALCILRMAGSFQLSFIITTVLSVTNTPSSQRVPSDDNVLITRDSAISMCRGETKKQQLKIMKCASRASATKPDGSSCTVGNNEISGMTYVMRT